MSRVVFSIAITLIAGLIVSGAATAQTPPPAPQGTMAVPPDLDAKIKKDVKERAEKRKKAAMEAKAAKKKAAMEAKAAKKKAAMEARAAKKKAAMEKKKK